MRTHPDKALVVLLEVANGRIRQPAIPVNDRELAIEQPIQSTAKGADPEHAFLIEMKTLNKIARQAIGAMKNRGFSLLYPAQATAIHSKPERAIALLYDGSDVPSGALISAYQPGWRVAVVTQEANRSSHKERIILTDRKRRHRGGQIFQMPGTLEQLAFSAIKAAAPRARPK